MDKKLKKLYADLAAATTDADKKAIQKDIDVVYGEIESLETKAKSSDENASESQKYRKRAQGAEDVIKLISEKMGLTIPESKEALEKYLDEKKSSSTTKEADSNSLIEKLQTALEKNSVSILGLEKINTDNNTKISKNDRDEIIKTHLNKEGVNSKFLRHAVRDVSEKSSWNEETSAWEYGDKTLEKVVEEYKVSDSDFFGSKPNPGSGSTTPAPGGGGGERLSQHV